MTHPDQRQPPSRATRRTFTREYKLKIVREAGQAGDVPGGVGALLRREGLYSSTLAAWRREFPLHGEISLAPVKRGPKAKYTPEEKALQRLESENERLKKKLAMAEALLDLQKKAQAIFEEFETKGSE
ncbi:MAG: transposase [Sumerlaeia bacterium]